MQCRLVRINRGHSPDNGPTGSYVSRFQADSDDVVPKSASGKLPPLLQCTFQRLVRVTHRVDGGSGANKRVLLQAVGLRWCSESDAKPTHLLVRLFHARIQLRFSTTQGARQSLFVSRSPCNRPRSCITRAPFFAGFLISEMSIRTFWWRRY